MCFWGVALTVGPNYNLPMTAEPRAKVAWNALQQAQANATAVQRSIHLSEKGESAAQQLDQICELASIAGFRRGKISESLPGSQITSRLPCDHSSSSSRYSARSLTHVEPKARSTSCPMSCCSPSSPW